ncbi:recombinase family protein [Streptomyces sp. NPDC051658]|uniref:recombinase family protein n=1 Tax=Streptomyces sp. NPDC051658 TaxID=3365667 RepID=UPI0037AA8373
MLSANGCSGGPQGRNRALVVAGLRKRGIGFQPLHESLDTTTPGGRLVVHVFAALAEFIRELTVQGTHEGLAAARARAERIGRPPAMTDVGGVGYGVADTVGT